MRDDWRQLTGLGELLCLVAAWGVAIGALWADFAARDQARGRDKVAVGETSPSGPARF